MANLTEEAKAARRQYQREWRKKNPDKLKAAQARHWEKVAGEAQEGLKTRTETHADASKLLPDEQDQSAQARLVHAYLGALEARDKAATRELLHAIEVLGVSDVAHFMDALNS